MPAGTGTSPSTVAATPARDEFARSESRKSSKPIMEKRRRARINESLAQLKTLILDALKKNSSRHSKLEKADILEMTVKHLRNVQRLQMSAAVNTDPIILAKYRAGFSECVGEVTRFLSTCEGVNGEVRTRLLGHLAACVTQISSVTLCGPHYSALGPTPPVLLNTSLQLHPSPEAVKVFAGLQVVPSPDGQFAVLVPSAALAPVQTHGTTAPPVVTSDSMWRPW
uniref:Hairy and enhancer of split 4 n=2 Tax=Nothobranchius TaxID=28779 RepID=A0A1A8HW76_NOTKU